MAGFGSISGLLAGFSGQLPGADGARLRARPGMTLADLPPWDVRIRQAPDAEAAARRVQSGRSVFGETPPTGRDPQVSDARKLAAAWGGFAQLKAIAEKAGEAGATPADRSRLASAFSRGWSEVVRYVDDLKLEKISVVRAEKLSRAETELAVRRNSFDYVGARIHEGDPDAPVAALAGDVRFTMSITRNGVNTAFDFDLAEMGETARTLAAVTGYVNAKLAAAGFATRLERERLVDPALRKGALSDDWAFKIDGLETEQVRLSGLAARPTLFAVGQEGIKGVQSTVDSQGKRVTTPTDIAGRLQRFNDLAAAQPSEVFTERLEATGPGAVRLTSVVSAPDGAVYAAGVASGGFDGLKPAGQSDVVLVKFDGQGRKLWTRMMGAPVSAADPKLAVGPDGQVAIAASIEGLMDPAARGGLRDTAIWVYDASGSELWARQQGAKGDDAPAGLAFAGDGRLVVAGRTAGSLASAPAGARADAYVQVFTTAGALQSTRQFADAGDSRATAVAATADGQAVVAVAEGGQARVHKLRLDDLAGPATWSYAVGAADVTAIAVDGDDIAIAGVTLDASIDAVNGGPAHAGGTDGFIARLTDGVQPSLAWGRFFGAVGSDRINALAISGGDILVGGERSEAARAGAALPRASPLTPDNGARPPARTAFLTSFAAHDGSQSWAREMMGRQGDVAIAGMAIDVRGQSGLDALGLPRGDIQTPESKRLADVGALRPGHHFFLQVEGGGAKRITIGADDTWASLALRINSAVALAARAEVTYMRGGERLQIKPTSGRRVEIMSGEPGRDALAGLGLKQGALIDEKRREARLASRAPAPEIVPLRVPATAAFTDAASARESAQAIDRVMANVRFAHTAATNPRGLERPGKRDGQPSATALAQLRNYQAGLRRLSGG